MIQKRDSGEIMLEGTIVMVITMMILVWILGLGFLHYQRYVVTIVTNDAATKVASTYSNPASDLIMGYVDGGDFMERAVNRVGNSELIRVNEERASSYIKYIMEKTNLSGTIKNVDVKLSHTDDSVFRDHIEIETTVTFKTPFGFALNFFGFDDVVSYKSVARRDCTDMMDYISTVDTIKNLPSASGLNSSKLLSILNSVVKDGYNITYFKNDKSN